MFVLVHMKPELEEERVRNIEGLIFKGVSINRSLISRRKGERARGAAPVAYFLRSLSFLPLAVRLWACSSWAAAFLLLKELRSSSRSLFFSSRAAFSSA